MRGLSRASFKTQYALERSLRSNPMVSCPLKMFFAFVRIVLIFCIAGLLFCALSTSNIGSVSHPAGDRPFHPSDLSRNWKHLDIGLWLGAGSSYSASSSSFRRLRPQSDTLRDLFTFWFGLVPIIMAPAYYRLIEPSDFDATLRCFSTLRRTKPICNRNA